MILIRIHVFAPDVNGRRGRRRVPLATGARSASGVRREARLFGRAVPPRQGRLETVKKILTGVPRRRRLARFDLRRGGG